MPDIGGMAYRSRPANPSMQPVLREESPPPEIVRTSDTRRAGEQSTGHMSHVLVHLVVTGQATLNGYELPARVALVRHEEQPGREPAQPVRTVHEVVAPAQQPDAAV